MRFKSVSQARYPPKFLNAEALHQVQDQKIHFEITGGFLKQNLCSLVRWNSACTSHRDFDCMPHNYPARLNFHNLPLSLTEDHDTRYCQHGF